MVPRARNLVMTVGLCFLLAVVGGSALAEHGGYGGYFGTDYDLGGATVTIWIHSDAAGEFDRFQEGRSGEGRVEEAEGLFNCKIEFRTASHMELYDVLMNRLLAGETTYDIWCLMTRYYWHFLSSNALYPVGSLLPDDYFERLPTHTQKIIDAMKYRGTRYVFSQQADYHDLSVGQFFVCWYNKDIFEREGVRDPWEIYLEGNWTWEEYGKCIEKLTKDKDGDGEIDLWGMSHPGFWVTQAWLASNGGKITEMDDDGRAKVVVNSEANRQTLAQLYEWFVVKNLVRRGGDMSGPFMRGEAATFIGQLWWMYNFRTGMDANVSFVPVPRGPMVDEHKFHTFDLTGWCLPSNAKDPEALLALHEFLFRDDPDFVEQELITNLQFIYPTREMAEFAIQITRDWDGSGHLVTTDAFEPLMNQNFTRIINGATTFQEVMDAVLPQLQDILDDVFNQ